MLAQAQSESKYSSLQLYHLIQNEQLNYIYRGHFTGNFTRNLISLAQSNIESEDTPYDLKRKVYHVMVEGLQNISRHQAVSSEFDRRRYGLFLLKKEKYSYRITTGNLIEDSEIGPLKGKLEKINQLDKEELKSYHKEVLLNTEISKKGGAGLGLIDIARRVESGIEYQFKKFNENLSFFYLQTRIFSNQGLDKTIESGKSHSLNYVDDLHSLLNKENILILFNNSFSQESLLEIHSFLESQMAENTKVKRTIFNIMIEMFQNIVKHGAVTNCASVDKPGYFYIAETDTEYILATGNFVSNNYLKSLRGRLNYVNNLDEQSLNSFYDSRLFNFEINSSKSAGLGLIEIRKKSGNNLDFEFEKHDKDVSFYTLKVKILKNK